MPQEGLIMHGTISHGLSYTREYQCWSDMMLAPSPIDNDGNYEPNNVRTSTNRQLTYQDRTQTVNEWAKELGIKRTTIRMRLDEYGW